MPAKLGEYIAAIAVRLNKLGRAGDGGIEARQCLLPPAEPRQCHAHKVVRTRPTRVDRQHLAREVKSLGKPPLVAGDLGERIKRIGMGRIVPEHLRVSRRRVRERTLPVQGDGLRKECGGGGIHDRPLPGAWVEAHDGRSPAQWRFSPLLPPWDQR